MGVVKKIPEGIVHTPSSKVWAEVTPLSEHKERTKQGVTVINGTHKAPLPLSRATTDLRRAYPYIFDCASYALTHNPEKVDTDAFYSRFTMPYHVFLDYCLDRCTEQEQYLKEQLYKILLGQPAKYIKVSDNRTVFAPPVIIALSHIEPKTGKEKRVTTIGRDELVDTIQVQILKQLLTFEHGYLNLPKAFYAKIRHIYTEMLNQRKRDEAAHIEQYQEQGVILKDMDQGGFYPIYLALEFIIAKKGRHTKKKEYDLLELCEKCYPDLVQFVGGKAFLRDRQKAGNFFSIFKTFTMSLAENKSIGIKKVCPLDGNKHFFVYFN